MKLPIVAVSLAFAGITLVPTAALAAPVPPVASTASARASDIVDRAGAFLAALRAQTVDRTQLTQAFADQFTPEVVTRFAQTLAGLGEPTSFAPRSKAVVDGVTTYDFTVGFASGHVVLVMGIDDATGKIARFYFVRA